MIKPKIGTRIDELTSVLVKRWIDDQMIQRKDAIEFDGDLREALETIATETAKDFNDQFQKIDSLQLLGEW